MSNQLSVSDNQPMNVYANSTTFEHAQRIAKALASSTLVPAAYQNNVSNTLVALEMANRIGASPLMVMQNLHVIQGRPSWSSTFIIAAINSCGRFAPLRYKMESRGMVTIDCDVWTGEKPNRRKETKPITVEDLVCRAWTTDASGEVLDGPAVSIEMAVSEGWYTKADSKWKTMPEVMLRYRAASFFGRLYAPEVMLGMHTIEEVSDSAVEVTTVKDTAAKSVIDSLNEAAQAKSAAPSPEPIEAKVIEPVESSQPKKPKASKPIEAEPAVIINTPSDDDDLI